MPVRLLHTSDWHVGKKIRGHSRIEEHREALNEIVAIAESEQVDLVIVAGDLFESAAPTPDAEQLVWETLLALATGSRHVVVIAGNHDNARKLDALAPVFAKAGVVIVAEPTRPDEGGVVELAINDQIVRLALLPFVSQRSIVRATELMANAAFEHAQHYSARMASLIETLCASFDAESINIIAAHGFLHGGGPGGGERAAHLIEEYAVSAQLFPATAHYVALGHLHRAQKIAGGTALHYSGSPLQLDFGEGGEVKSVNVVELAVGKPAKVDRHTLKTGRPLRTVSGSLSELRTLQLTDDPWLRVRVQEASRVGLADDVRDALGEGVVDVTVVSNADVEVTPPRRDLNERSHREVFQLYLDEQGVADERLITLFDDLTEELQEVDRDEATT